MKFRAVGSPTRSSRGHPSSLDQDVLVELAVSLLDPLPGAEGAPVRVQLEEADASLVPAVPTVPSEAGPAAIAEPHAVGLAAAGVGWGLRFVVRQCRYAAEGVDVVAERSLAARTWAGHEDVRTVQH